MTQTKVGWRAYVDTTTSSTLWNSIYSVYNADSVGSSSLKTSLYSAYNGESNANDSFGSNNGTPQGGLTYATGKIGNAFNFNGTNSYVNLGNDKFNFTGNFSISGWIYLNTVSGNQGILSNLSFVSPNISNGFLLLMRNQKLSFELYQNNNTYTPITSTANLNSSTWYHISIVRVASQSTKIYINGILDNSNSSTYNPTYSSSIPIPSTIGAWKYDSTNVAQYTNGRIDALNVWQKELTQEEITDLYNSGNGSQYITDSFYKPTTNDALGTNNGTAQGGLTYVPGKIGTAFQFNGTNAYVSLPNNSLKLTGDFSFSLWFNAGALSGFQSLIGNYTWESSLYDRGFQLVLNNAGMAFRVFGSSFITLSASGTFTTSTWNHIVVTRKAATGTKIYVNGSLNNSNTSAVDPIYASTHYNSIGASKYNSTSLEYYFNGKMDETYFWNKELTSSEITELYNSGNGKQYPN